MAFQAKVQLPLHQRIHESHIETKNYMLILVLCNTIGTLMAIGFILCLQRAISYASRVHRELEELREVRAEGNNPP